MNGKIVEVADNVYAYIQGRGEWFVNNSGLIVVNDFAVIVDSLCNEKRAEKMLKDYREVTDKDFRFLVNTHGHPDHVWTNHVFNAVTIANEEARKDTLSAFVEIYQSLFPDLDFSGAKITPQDLTFEKRMKIHGEIEILLNHPGTAHTKGDCYVYLPKRKVVFCGDLLFTKPCTPLALGGSVKGYIAALNELLSLDAEIYIPGHGSIGGREEVEAARHYMEFVYEEAKKRFERGMNWLEAAIDIDLGEFKSWGERERIIANVARAYADLEQRDMNLTEMIEVAKKMLEYARGELK